MTTLSGSHGVASIKRRSEIDRGYSAGMPGVYRGRCECGWVSGWYLGPDLARRRVLSHVVAERRIAG